MMRNFVHFFGALLLLLLPSLSFAQAVPESGPVREESVEDRQVREVAKDLRCAVCQNESVADSGSELARSMRSLIRDRLREGETPEQVKAYFVSRYGDYILMEPRKEGINIFLWGIPFLVLLLGIAAIVMRRQSPGKPAPERAETHSADETIVDSQQLIARLRESSRDETENQ
jgi:cytochrome c-type biogenesis protein CcmH